MAAIAECARSTSSFEWRVVDAERSRQPQGSEGTQLGRKQVEALQHWDERAEVLLAELDFFIAGSDEIVPEAYTPVPPNRTFLVRTRYVDGGKGEPVWFDLDDE